jgi:hypothetical protein
MLQAQLDSLDGLPEAIASEYAKGDDGKFLLQVGATNGFALENVNGLKTALGKERENVATANAKLLRFGELEPGAAHAALLKVQEMQDWTPDQKSKEAAEAQISQLNSKHGKEMAKVADEAADLRNQLKGQLVTNDATAAIVAAGGNVELLLPHVEKQMKMADVDGKYVAQVIDDDGIPRVSMKTGSTDSMGIGELVESMKSLENFAPAFAGSGASGSGAFGSRAPGGSGGNIVLTWDEAHNPGAYAAAKEAADKSGGTVEILPFESAS